MKRASRGRPESAHDLLQELSRSPGTIALESLGVALLFHAHRFAEWKHVPPFPPSRHRHRPEIARRFFETREGLVNVDPAFLSHLQVSKEEGVALPLTRPTPRRYRCKNTLCLREEENTRSVPPRLTGFFRSNCVQRSSPGEQIGDLCVLLKKLGSSKAKNRAASALANSSQA